jgi:triphosphoribosyl-dephospho-CoA synthase
VPTPDDVSLLASLACQLEAAAPKPGNVSPGRPFRDMCYEDFLVSALAIGPVLGQAARRAVGETAREAIRATRRWTAANTNLGIVLLLAPLCRALLRGQGGPWRQRVAAVLAELTVADAVEAYAAIREAGAGGLGKAETQDLGEVPTISLLEAMRLAADRDSIAREYATGFELTFETGAPALRAARSAGLDWPDATVETFLALLAARPDTLIARKLGRQAAQAVTDRAGAILRLGGARSPAGRAALAAFDADLRDAQNSRNPGTTADLTAAALFVALAEDGWRPAP